MFWTMLMLTLTAAAAYGGTNLQQSKSLSLNDIATLSQDLHDDQRKGLEYYLINYGPLVKVILTDVMDTIGFTKTYQLAIPVIGKLVIIGMCTAMQFLPSLMALQPATHAAFTFFRHFNSPQLKVINEVTDNIFDILNNEIIVT